MYIRGTCEKKMNYIYIFLKLLNWALPGTNLTQFIIKSVYEDHDISFSFVGSDQKSVKFISGVYSFQHFDKLQL